MATIATTSDLDVIAKYNELVNESLGGDSVYVRTKEVLDQLFEDGTIKGADKANVISQVISALNTSVVTASMGTALQWASTEKDIALKKLELSKQLDILDNDILIREGQVKKTTIDNINAQAQGIRVNGVATVVGGDVTSLSDEGKLYYDTLNAAQQHTNAQQEENILISKEKESQATVHKIVADTYTNYGNFTYTVGNTGLTSVTDNTAAGYTTLSSLQGHIATEQAKGYAYNAWANAATGVASTVGVAITSELPIFDSGEIGYTLVQNLIDSTNNLKNIPVPTI